MLLPKRDGYTIATPLSRQNKGWDLLVYRTGHARALTLQVKSSRSYQDHRKTGRSKNTLYHHYLWFKRFDFNESAADFYVLFGLYSRPENKKLDKSKPKRWWAHVMLLFTASEMANFLAEVAPNGFFDLGFDADPRPRHIFRLRGAKQRDDECYEHFLLENRAGDLKEFLAGGAPADRQLQHHLGAG